MVKLNSRNLCNSLSCFTAGGLASAATTLSDTVLQTEIGPLTETERGSASSYEVRYGHTSQKCVVCGTTTAGGALTITSMC